MFIQVIQGSTNDEPALRAATDRWQRELAQGADGWLGATYGVTDDGEFVGVVRFESEEAARRNSERPEQGAWWSETERLFSGPCTFRDCADVTTMLRGGSDDAGFVQVLQGRVTDRDRMVELTERAGPVLSSERPEIIGSTLAITPDGQFTETVAFTSEQAAREGEWRELGAPAHELMAEQSALMQDVTFLDLHRPWFAAPR